MMFRRTVQQPRHEKNDAEVLRARRAEAEREYLIAREQEAEADTAVSALEQTRLRNGFAPAIIAGIMNNRGDM